MIVLKIQGNQYPIELEDNLTVSNLLTHLPLKVNYQPYSDIEIYGKVPKITYDKGAASTKAVSGQLKYCLEYHSLVLVCQNHRDIFNEVNIGTVKIPNDLLEKIVKTTDYFTISTSKTSNESNLFY